MTSRLIIKTLLRHINLDKSQD